MAYLKYILITGLLLSGLMEPVLFNGLFNCNLFNYNLVRSGLAHGHKLNSGLSHTLIPDTPLFYFERNATVRETNGQRSQKFSLIFEGDDPDLMEVYFTEDLDSTIYKADIKNGNVLIKAHRPTLFRLWALARTGKNTFVAHTSCVLYGNSRIKAERVIFFPTLHGVPYIEMLFSHQTFWPQTGQEFIFRVNSGTELKSFPAPERMTVYSNNGVIDLKPDDTLRYAYIPAHDRRLRQTSVKAGRNDILFTKLKGTDQNFNLTHTLYVHRSRTAFKKYPIGAVVFGVSFFFFTSWIIFNRKKSFPW